MSAGEERAAGAGEERHMSAGEERADGGDPPRAPREIELHLARTEDAGDPFSFPYGPGRHGTVGYLRTRADGTSADAHFAWDEAVFSDLLDLRSPTPDPGRLPGLGARLRRFLGRVGWEADERLLLEDSRQPVQLTLDLGAAELFALPWEAVELPSGARLGKLPHCLIRYAWPGSATAPRAPDPPPENGRILVAWSAGGMGVPHEEQVASIRGAYKDGGHPDVDRGVIELGDASLRALGEALAAHAPVHVLHLVCHGGSVASERAAYGLRLRTPDGAGYEVVEAERLADKLRPHAGELRLCVLCACHGGDAGEIDSRLGSVALALHRAGIPAVVASRYPLSWDGAGALTEALYRELLVEHGSLEGAFAAARERLSALAADAGGVDWASLQLYARAADGPDHRPVVLRPYRGLLAFQREHARYFHGRQQETEEAVSDLMRLVEGTARRAPRFLIVTGASGTGKSSLVLAGVVPALKARDPRWVAPPALRPAPDFRERLAQALAARRDPAAPLLLVVDQFEEIFTVLPDKAAREGFLGELWRLAGDASSGVSVLATLRVDFLGRCGELRLGDGEPTLEQVAYDEAHRIFVRRMGRDDLAGIIERPAAQVGLALDEGLAAQMLDDAGDEPGALPLLEYTLDELWKRRRGRRLAREDYERLGGVTGALARRADAILDGLDEIRRRAARRLLVQLVDARDDAALNTRRRRRLDELRRGPDAEAAVFDEVLALLARERLVVVGGDEERSAEIAHEQLIRSWGRLRGWVGEDRKMTADLELLATWTAEASAYDHLLEGKRLALAQELLSRHEHEIEPGARSLIARSREAEARRRLRARAAGVAAGVLAVVMGALAFVAWSKSTAAEAAAEQARQAAEEASRAAEEARRKTIEARDAALMAGVRELASRDPRARVSELLLEVAAPERARGWTQLALDALSTTAPSRTPAGLMIDAAAFRADGACLVVASNRRNEVQVRELGGAGKILATRAFPVMTRLATFSPDRRRVALSVGLEAVHVVELDGSGATITLAGPAHIAAFSPDGRRLATDPHPTGMTARVWELDGSGKFIDLEGHTSGIFSATFSPDGKRLATASRDGTARVWELDGSGRSRELKGHTGTVTSAAFSPDGKRLVTTSDDRTARVWELDDPERSRELRGHTAAVYDATFSPDGKRLVTVAFEATVRVFPLDGPGELLELERHTAAVSSAAFSPDGKRLVTASKDARALVWELDGPGELLELRGHEAAVRGARFSPDGERVVTVSDDGSARLWPVTLPGLRRQLQEATTSCLPPEMRALYAGESEAEARAKHADCERSHGRTPGAPAAPRP
ncbi:CHAT domain-containing protein [Sorangium sp. So ce260]|uniref:nSTAND1 domain-containing NTPase n=1 Tax=Sorangium sp. So ce260 TaxID=3133291 RepID=UPI003F634D3D